MGTSPITPSDIHNYSFDNRILAASELYKKGKKKKLVVSGGDYSPAERFGIITVIFVLGLLKLSKLKVEYNLLSSSYC